MGSDRAAWYDAVVVAGGRASRLGGIDKTALCYDGVPLVGRALNAARDARRVVVVGHSGPLPSDPRVSRTVESPRWSGPASAVVAGLDRLGETAPWVAVLAADLPHVERALPRLVSASADAEPAEEGVLAIDETGRAQPLLAIYRGDALRRAAVAAAPVAGLGMHRLIAALAVRLLPLGDGVCADVDTEADARAWGIELPAPLEAAAARIV